MGLNCTPQAPPAHPHPAGPSIPPQKTPANAVSLHRAELSQTLQGAVSSPGLCMDDSPSELGLFQTTNPSKQLLPALGDAQAEHRAGQVAGRTNGVPGRAQGPLKITAADSRENTLIHLKACQKLTMCITATSGRIIDCE